MTLGLIQLATFFLSTFLIIALHHHFKKTKPPLHHHHHHHPPTPFSLPIVGHLHLLSPLIHHSFHRLSSLHGPLIRLRLGSVPCVVVSTPEYAREFLKTNELNFSTRHDSTAINRLTYNSSFAFAPHGPYWKFIKKLASHELLANRNLNQFLPIRNRELLCFLQTLTKKAKACEAVNVTEELLKLTNNVISQIMLGIRSSGTEGEADEARTLVREVSRIFGEFNLSDFIWFLKRWDLQGIGKRCEDIYAKYDALLEKIITDREEMRKENGDGKSAKDFLDILVDALENEDSEIKLTRDHVKALILNGPLNPLDPKGENINGTDEVVDMTERPGLTAPRAHDLVCMPVARMDLLDSLLDP
ncbi:hypothetical protein C3L33_06959, partial [Rhododendron williamsianum]